MATAFSRVISGITHFYGTRAPLSSFWNGHVPFLCPEKCVHCPANDNETPGFGQFCTVSGILASGTRGAIRGGVNVETEYFFPSNWRACAIGQYIRERLPLRSNGLPSVACGWTDHKTFYISWSPVASLVLKYREPGKRPNTERWATRKVSSVREAVEYMNQNKDRAFLPASVQTNAWSPEIVAILG